MLSLTMEDVICGGYHEIYKRVATWRAHPLRSVPTGAPGGKARGNGGGTAGGATAGAEALRRRDRSGSGRQHGLNSDRNCGAEAQGEVLCFD